ncbi:MAG: pyruvate kinase [Bacteroidetes bacterium]|nr:pyruvate kinase [Bacteroidota bacterium]
MENDNFQYTRNTITFLKKTKIVATMGPSSMQKDVLKEMILDGLNVCRLNFSHGSHDDHLKTIEVIRELNDELGLNVSILADLQGPKIRTHEMENDSVELNPGHELLLVVDKVIGTSEKISINYNKLPREVKAGERILLDDGKIVLEVISTDFSKEIRTKIINGGILSSNKGINFPNTQISLPSLTEKDRLDLEFAIKNRVDWIGLSFVRSAQDIVDLKLIITENKSNTRVIAKIEKPEAVNDIDNILNEADGLMVARGDLGVEIPYQQVPLIQKMLIQKAIRVAKPIIVATQMMESMITNLTPTRAEVNDVANAVLDGADAVMLSGETSVGQYPVQVIQSISKIVMEVEKYDQIYNREEIPSKVQDRFITDSICFNACRLSQRVEANALITMTFSGYTAYKLSSQRPKSPIYVFTSNPKILSQLNLIWGVKTFYYNKRISTDHTIADIKYLLKKYGFLSEGDLVVNIASIPLEDLGGSNMLKLSYVD